MDPTAQQVGIGGTLFLAALGMLLKFKPWERKSDDSGTNGHSGSKPVSYWQQEFRKAVKEELDDWGKGRLEKFEQVVKDEMKETRHDLRNEMQKVVNAIFRK